MANDEADHVRRDFRDAVNVTPGELETWLGSDESTGHESGRRIVDRLRTKRDDLTDDGLAHMRKAQRPGKSEIETSPRRYSLMNAGHDPLEG